MDGRRMPKTTVKQQTRSASERSLPLSNGKSPGRNAPNSGSASCSSLPPILEPAATGQFSARSNTSPRPASPLDTSGPNTSGLGLSSPRPMPSPRPEVADLAAITLDGLWLLIVSEYRTLSEAIDFAGLGNCEVFDEVNTRTLVAKTVGESRADDCTAVLLDAMRKPGGALVATRDCLLSTLGSIPPRQRFRDWANTMLLLFSNLVELGCIFASGARPSSLRSEHWKRPARAWEKTGQVPLDAKAFRESLIMFDVNVNDANMWFDRLAHRDCWPQEALDFGVLVRRIVSQPWLEGDKDLENQLGPGAVLAHEDVAVRLLHAWGDLSSAFMLKPASEKNVGPRPANGAERISNYSAARYHAQEEARPPSASAPTVEQWTRALRGSNKTRLLAETEAKAEAIRQVSLHRDALQQARQEGKIGAYSYMHLVSLFSNLSDHLLLSRCNFFPQELIVVRYSLADHGFLGSAIMPSSRRTLYGSHPVVAIVPLDGEGRTYEMQLDRPRKRATEPHNHAPINPAKRIGTVSIRAPCQTDSGGFEGYYAVQLYATEDGSLGTPIGNPVVVRIIPRPPQVPSKPFLVSKKGKSLELSWVDPVDDGGAPLNGHILGLWKVGPTSSIEFEPDVVCEGTDIWPPCTVKGLQSETEYIARVRCVSDGGQSFWSAASEKVSTMSPEPGDLGAPQISEQVTPDSVTITWAPHDFRVDSYEVMVTPCDGSVEPWTITVAPPQAPASKARAGSPLVRKLLRDGESPNRNSPRRRTNGINGTSGAATKVVMNGLLSNSRYQFAVRATNGSGIGPFSEQSKEALTGPGKPSKPGAPVQVSREKHSVTLKWNPPQNDGGSQVVRYMIEGREDRSSNSSPREEQKTISFNTPDASTTWVAKKLRGNTRYVFRVYALNAAGLSEASDPSETASTAATEPEAPGSLRVTDSQETQLELRWNAPASDGGAPVSLYHVEVRQRRQDLEIEPYRFTQESLGVIVSQLHGNIWYDIKVCAENAVGRSAYAQLLARTGAVFPGPPGAPRCLGDPLSTSATLAWSPPADDGGAAIEGYTLRCYASGGAGEEDSREALFTLDTLVPRERIEGLTASAYYRFRVQARNSCGLGPCSKWSPLVMTAPPPPATPGVPFVYSATSQTILVRWDDLGADDSYYDIDRDVAPMEYEVAITRHEAEDGTPLSPGPPEKTMKVHSTQAQFRGLRMFSTYSFRVRARGRGGWSDWSLSSLPRQTTNEWSTEEVIDFLMQRCGYSLAGVFRNIDRDCDGFISSDNFLHGLDRLGLHQVSEERKLALFAEADEGCRGCITLREFNKCFGAAASAAAAAARRQANSRSRTCLTSPVEDPQASTPAPSSPLQQQRRPPAAVSPSPINGRRSLVTRRSTSPPVPRSLSPQVVRTSLRRSGASTQSLSQSAPAKAGKSTAPTDDIFSGSSECGTSPSKFGNEVAVQLASSKGEASYERDRTIARMKSAPGPLQKNRGQKLLFPR